MDQAWGCGEVVLRPHTAHRTKNWSQVAVGGWRSLEAVLKGRGRRKLACAGGGGVVRAPFPDTPPPLLGSRDGDPRQADDDPQRADRGVWGSMVGADRLNVPAIDTFSH